MPRWNASKPNAGRLRLKEGTRLAKKEPRHGGRLFSAMLR
jgi:hypothetical protein